ncbi:MAG: AI-2E family transporter [Gaiellales bacterium]
MAMRRDVEPPRRVEVSVSMRTLAVLGGAGLLAWAFIAARQAILLVFISLFLALVLDTPVTWMTRRWHVRRGNAATGLVLGLVVLLGALVTLLVTPFIGAVGDLIEDLPNIVQRIRESDLFQRLDARTDIGEELQKHAQDLAGSLPGQLDDLFALGGKVFGAGLTLFTLTFMTLFLLVDLPNLSAAIRSLLFPATAERVERMQQHITATIGRYALGAVAIATIAGTVQGTGAWILGAPFALALGIIAGLLGLIPQVGATIAAVLLSLVTLTVGVPQALIMLVVCVGYQQLENVLLQPTIQGKAADISGFFVIASVIVGAALLGVVGALIAVPLTASIQIVVREITAERRAAVAAAREALEPPAPPPETA